MENLERSIQVGAPRRPHRENSRRVTVIRRAAPRKRPNRGPCRLARTLHKTDLLIMTPNLERSSSSERALLPALLVLTVSTGIVDAVSYLGLGHIFCANMTGNVVILAFALVGASGVSIT